MDILEIEYLKELKKNIKLKRQKEVLNKIKNKDDIQEIISKKIPPTTIKISGFFLRAREAKDVSSFSGEGYKSSSVKYSSGIATGLVSCCLFSKTTPSLGGDFG